MYWLNRMKRKLKAKLSPLPKEKSLKQSGIAFTTTLLDNIELFRKNTSDLYDIEYFQATSGQYILRDGIHTLTGHGASGEFVVRNTLAVALLFIRHPYSGTVRIIVNDFVVMTVNLNAPFKFIEPIAVASFDEAQDVLIKIEVLEVPGYAHHCNEVLLWKILTPSSGQKIKTQDRDSPCECDKEYYTQVNKEQFDAWDRYVINLGYTLDEAAKLVSEVYYKRLDKVFSLCKPHGRVLDIGCGFCAPQHLNALVERYTISQYQGHDISQDVVRLNNDSMASFGSKFNFLQGLNTTLPYPENSFSFIYSGHCIEHSDNIQQTFFEVARVLQPGGIFYFHVPLSWDATPEHIYYFNPLCWALLGKKMGLNIHSVAFGPLYNILMNDWDTEIILINGKSNV